MLTKLSALLLIGLFLMAGCSTIPHKVDLLYKPLASTRGGSGKIYLVTDNSACNQEKLPIRWVIGNIQNEEGTSIEEIITPISPSDQVSDAFKQELESAGYTVYLDNNANPSTDSLIRLSNTKISLSEVPSFLKITSTVKISTTVEQWKSGKMLKKEEYETGYTDTYSRTQEQQMQSVLQKALEGITSKAVPDIIQTFSK